jgi:hypothetical protein
LKVNVLNLLIIIFQIFKKRTLYLKTSPFTTRRTGHNSTFPFTQKLPPLSKKTSPLSQKTSPLSQTLKNFISKTYPFIGVTGVTGVRQQDSTRLDKTQLSVSLKKLPL